MKLVVAKLQRHQFGRKSESPSIDQLQLLLNGMSANTDQRSSSDHKPASSGQSAKKKPARKPLPDHLPREDHHHDGEDASTGACSHCGGDLHFAGEDVSEMLEYVPAHFKVIRHIRSKWACKCCNTLIQAAAPERPIPQGIAGPDLLAQIMVSKYCDHLPLYRQSRIYARDGVDLPVSTLSDWVGKTSMLLSPLVEAIWRHTTAGESVHADDTPLPVLQPGLGRTKTGRLWTYVRDETPRASQAPPSVWFAYTPDRKGIHPQKHLQHFSGIVHADGYAGFNALYQDGGCVEAACWAHVRRKFYDIYQAQSPPQALQAIELIARLYQIEDQVRGQPPDERKKWRQAHSVKILEGFRQWLDETLMTLPRKSDLAGVIRYALTRWTALTRYCNDGRIEVDNNAAERALRAVAIGRKNYLFAGSDAGGERAAALYSLIGTAKLNGIDPMAYLRHVIAVIATHPINRIEALLPRNVQLPASDSSSTSAALKEAA